MSNASVPLRLLVIGAHPDDAEYRAGGLAALYRKHGHAVKFVSVTNGEAGHHQTTGPTLVARRRAESRAATEPLGIEVEVWDNPDGRLVVDLDRREEMIRAIRNYKPDLVLTHRPNDYHPDHRAVSMIVQDSAYLLTVPAVCPDVPFLRRDPVIAYLSDDFQKPYPLDPTVLVDISSVWDAKISLLDAHASQFYEWLPANMDRFSEVPETRGGRRQWLDHKMQDSSRRLANRFRSRLFEMYGDSWGGGIELVEAFEGCEYGARLDPANIARLFPFLPG